MARESSIPEEIRKYAPGTCCRIRRDTLKSGEVVYRVYRYKGVKLPDGDWGATSGDLLGKIIPGKGFVPNEKTLRAQAKEKAGEGPGEERFVCDDEITDVQYGKYALLMSLSGDVLERLEKCFPAEKAAQIYSYSLILCANDFLHIDQIDDFYQESFLSVVYRGYSFKMGYTALSGLLHDLGARGGSAEAFEQSLIDEDSGDVAIDGYVMRSCSKDNDLAERGYKINLLKAPQVNILVAYDIKNRVPLLYRTYRGSSADKVSVVDLLTGRSFRHTKFVVDKGFYSRDVLGLMSKDGNRYIISMKESNGHVKRIKEHLAFDTGEFVYKPNRKETARVVYQEEATGDGTRIIAYKDMDENNSKRKSYRQHMALGEGNYTQEEYDRYSDWWGVCFLQTNTEEPAAEVYSDYKGRWTIERHFNYVRNDGDFKDLKIQDYYVRRGFDFIMLVTGLLHSRLNEAVRKMGRSDISTCDVLYKSGHMRMVLNGDEWRLCNTRKKDIDLLNKMGFTPAPSYPATITTS